MIHRVKEPGNWSNTGMGRSDTLNGEILINPKLQPSQHAQVLMHEVVHYILDSFSYADEANNEQLVSAIANSMCSFIQDNLDTIKFIHIANKG